MCYAPNELHNNSVIIYCLNEDMWVVFLSLLKTQFIVSIRIYGLFLKHKHGTHQQHNLCKT